MLKKNIYPTIVFFNLLFAISVKAQLVNYGSNIPVNYVKVLEPTAPFTTSSDVLSASRTVEEVKRTTQYFDGLGRPIQTVSWQTTPLKKDLVAANVYDAFGREAQQYLPFVSTTNNGNFKNNVATEQLSFNTAQFGTQGETFFYSKTDFEPSPLNRPIKAMAPGNSWLGASKGVQQQYLINTVNDAVRIWNIGYTMDGTAPTSTATYPAGELYKNVSIDEHNKQVVEFKDKEGKVILKKVQIDNTVTDGHDGWYCTYYVYDDFGNLRYVVPPKAVTYLIANGWSFTNPSPLGEGLGVRSELCFYYLYDAQNRMVIKKVPGAGEVHMVYDERDRLVMTQDANLRVAGKWMVTIYDALNRPVKTGLWSNANDRTYHQNLAAAQTSLIEYPTSTNLATGFDLLTETGYDDYSTLPSASGLTATLDATNINGTNFITTYNAAPNYALPIQVTNATKGMPTWTKIKVLDGSPTPNYLYTLTLYDDYGKPIQSKSKNITGGTDLATMQYDFAGKVLRTHQSHQKLGGAANVYNTLTKPSYDHMGRVLNIKKTISTTGTPAIAGVEKTIAVNTYNELGQLKTKKLAEEYNGGLGLENQSYDYNIRGWLLGLNRDYAKDATNANYFGFDLGYDKTANGLIGNSTYSKAQYNGNIAGTVWKTKGDGEKRKFDYDYDNANRLLKADFNQYTNGSFNQNEGLNFNIIMGDGSLLPDGSIDYAKAYDENGNIKQMQQWGYKVGGSVQIDNLKYNYIANSNKLLNVIDAALVTPPSGGAGGCLGDFRTSLLHPNQTKTPTTTEDYTYDVNGNLKKDLNKDIGNAATDGIVYNYLNLPQTITVRKDANGANIKGTIEYIYDATGNKLCKKTTEGSTITKTTYTSGYVYESKTGVNADGDQLQFTGHEEGRIRPIFNSQLSIVNFVYDYMLKDHLGNVRMVLTEEQKVDVYPLATMEDATIAIESNYYGNLPQTQTDKPSWFYDGIDPNSTKVARLLNKDGDLKVGPNIILKVMAGDSYNVRVTGAYKTDEENSDGSYTDVFQELLNLVTNSIATVNGGKASATELQNNTNLINSLSNFVANQTTSNPAFPKSYLNWILFDEQFNMVANSSGFIQVGVADKVAQLVTQPNLTVSKNGFLYIYTSNQSKNIDVYFDNLQVTHNRGAILEETHYYPFGLTMAGISSKAAGMLENKRKWNKGSDLQSNEFSDGSGLEIYSTFYRSLDPQIGRFWQIDPKPNDLESPYVAMGNNPIIYNDPLGDTIPIDLFKGDNNTKFKNAAKSIGDGKNDGVFVLLAHSNSFLIESKNNGETEQAESGKEVSDLLSNESSQWKTAIDEKKKVTLIIYGCNTNSEEFYDTHFGEGVVTNPEPIAKEVSKYLSKINKNSTVVASDGYVMFMEKDGKSKMVGVQQTTAAEHINTGNGGFITIKNGIDISKQKVVFNGTMTPTKPR